MTKINILSGLNIPSQISLDPKTRCLNELTLKDLGLDDNLAYTYYKGLKVTCIEERTDWEWKEVEIGDDKLLDNDFTYPNGLIVDDIDYSNKIYNFAKISNVPELQDLQSVINTGGVAEILNKIVAYINQGDTNNKYTQFSTFTDDGFSNSISITKTGPYLYGSALHPSLINPQASIDITDGLINIKQFKGSLNTSLNFITPIANTVINLPAKSAGTYTLATLSDITGGSQNLQNVLNVGSSVTNANIVDSSTFKITANSNIELLASSTAELKSNGLARLIGVNGPAYVESTNQPVFVKTGSSQISIFPSSQITLNGSWVSTNSYLNIGTYTVSTLPSPNTSTAYATVTDAVSPTYLGTLTGGGSIKCPVFYNGTTWVSH